MEKEEDMTRDGGTDGGPGPLPSLQVPVGGGGSDNHEGSEKELVSILFPEEEMNKDKTLGPDELAYLQRLGTMGLESLMGEVARVGEELAIIEHQTRDMASQNYQIFVQSAQTTNLIKKSLSDAKNSVEQLTSDTFPSFLKEKTQEFLSQTRLEDNLSAISVLEEKQNKIEAILDMGWTLRRCLAQGGEGGDKMLPEAIKILHAIIDFKKGVEQDDSEIPPVLNETMNSVLSLQTQIQSTLLQKLQSPSITLSECLQTIQLLRSFFPSDQALRFRFLQSRMNLSLSFDNSRSWIFDTLTQHRAAFGQDSAHFLSTFTALQIQKVMQDLQKQLDHPSGGTGLDSLFNNSVYFGESLARVGADSRGLSTPIFAEFINKKVSHDLLQAEMNFARNLHQFNLSTCLMQKRAQQQTTGIEDEEVDFPSLPEDDLRPPPQLLSFPPLAVYCNEVLTLLNFVGKCPLSQTVVEIARKLNQSVVKIGHELEGWGQGEWVTWEGREQALFYRMRKIYEQLLVPHFNKCIRTIFPPSYLSRITGLGVAKCAEIQEIKYARSTVDNTNSSIHVSS